MSGVAGSRQELGLSCSQGVDAAAKEDVGVAGKEIETAGEGDASEAGELGEGFGVSGSDCGECGDSL